MHIRTVIFDVDGPLFDSFREGLRRIEALCKINGIEFSKAKRQRLIQIWGKWGVQLLEEGLGITKELAEHIYPQWEALDLVMPVPLIPGTRDALRYNRQMGIKNCILTSRLKQNFSLILEKQDLTREFTIVSTREDTEFKKPDPRVFDYVLCHLAEDFSITREGCIFVGDTPEDITCGQAAGIETLVVLTGPYWLEHILQYPVKPTNILPSVDYLPEWIDRYQNT